MNGHLAQRGPGRSGELAKKLAFGFQSPCGDSHEQGNLSIVRAVCPGPIAGACRVGIPNMFRRVRKLLQESKV